jgi:hypothetical protein
LILLEKPPAGGHDKIALMYIAITLSLILITALALVILRVFRPGFTASWPVAVFGAFLAWISVILWQISLPSRLVLYQLEYPEVFSYTISLSANEVNFPYGLGIASLVLAVLLTSAIKARETNPLNWAYLFIVSALGLLAVLAENPLTIVVAWSLLDISGLISSLNASNDPIHSKRAVFSFSTRVIGSGVVLWAGILSAVSFDIPFNQGKGLPSIVGLIILGATIRSFSMLLPFPYSKDAAIRKESETAYLLVSIVGTLALLLHVDMNISALWPAIILFLFIAITSLISVNNWLRNPHAISNQSQWMTGLVALSLSAALMGNSLGSVAWGSACLFGGGLLFLYSHRNRILTIALLIAVYILSSLPFSLTSAGWSGLSSGTWFFLFLLLPVQSLLTAGYIRSVALEEKESLENQPRWVTAFYPLGLITLALTGLVLGVTGWEGAGQMGSWIPALAAAALTILFSAISFRTRLPAPADPRPDKRPATWAAAFFDIWQGSYRALRRLLTILTMTFEGDGGILWTILFMIVFISILGIYAF